MTVSPAYAELGGGLSVTPLPTPSVSWTPPGTCKHMFDPISGWCGCGRRDDGALAEGSPAWRAALERAMPNG